MNSEANTKLLIADDNDATRRLLETTVEKWGYDAIPTSGGRQAWEKLRESDPPKMALLDWQMPDMSGVEVCQKIQQVDFEIPPYVILLTSRDKSEDIIEGLGAGANDFVPKAAGKGVLRARLEVGRRAIQLNERLSQAARAKIPDNFQEKQQMEQTIAELKKKTLELEKKLAGQNQGAVQEETIDDSADILDEIIVIFKRGEISLPSPPQIGVKFKEMVSNGANLQDIAGLLRQDAAVSSKLISISNSAFYRGVAENKNLDQAVGRLGLTTTKQYVDAITNRSLYYTNNKDMKHLIERLWEHSLASAYASQITCQVLHTKVSEDPFTLGLLHDIGRLVLLQAVGELQLKKKLGDGIDDEDLSETIDQNHGKFGAALLKRWKFSNEYITASSYHDDLSGANPVSKDLMVVHFGNLLARSLGYSVHFVNDVDLEDTESARLLKAEPDQISRIRDRVEDHMREMKGYFQ